MSQEIGYLFAGGEGFIPFGAEKNKCLKNPPNWLLLCAKIQTLQQNTATIKKALISGYDSLENGDNIACDVSGTYSLHEDTNQTGDEETSTYMNKLTLSFDECVMDNMVGSEALNFFEDMIMNNSIINRLNYYEASSSYNNL